MLFRLLLLLASAAALVSSQSAVTIDPNTVPLSTRKAWCNSQTSACPLLCLQIHGVSGPPLANNCSAQTLAYSCICSNNASPNASQYSQTIPYYVCTEQNNQCVNNCNQGDSICQSNCRNDNPCGAQSPKLVNLTTTTTTTAVPSATSHTLKTPVSTATGSAPRLGEIDIGYVYGLCVLMGGFIAGFVTLL